MFLSFSEIFTNLKLIFFFLKRQAALILDQIINFNNPIRALYILIKIFKFKGMALGH
jgi:hypothetical protein